MGNSSSLAAEKKKSISDQELDLYLTGLLPARRAQVIEKRLASDPALNAQLDEALAVVEPFAPAKQHQILLFWSRLRWAWLLGSGVVAILLIFGLSTSLKPYASQLGSLKTPDGARLHLVQQDGQPLGDILPVGCSVRVAYTNNAAFSHLAVFAVAQKGETFWYFPEDGEWLASQSIRIERGENVHVGDISRHQLTHGHVAFYGVFSRLPLKVAAIDAAVWQLVKEGTWNAKQPPRLPIADSAQTVVTAEVVVP